ncbi:hypothetical protein [Staphylococcus haemolyticus]|uniref:hypothetical protein n=1 Tax=Staphylococcus haemolyticus TaxID=1283 RepID=UPI00069EAD5C
MHGSLIIIESSLSDLNPSERRVAEYILEHPDEIINYSFFCSLPVVLVDALRSCLFSTSCSKLQAHKIKVLKIKIVRNFFTI